MMLKNMIHVLYSYFYSGVDQNRSYFLLGDQIFNVNLEGEEILLQSNFTVTLEGIYLLLWISMQSLTFATASPTNFEIPK